MKTKTVLKVAAMTLSVGLSLLMSGQTLASEMMFKHKDNGVQCLSCHKKVGDKVQKEACFQCHKHEAIIKKTEHLNFEATLKNPKTGQMVTHTALVNPHDSYHFGQTESCFDCHREHKPSTNECQTCHDIKAWKMGAPR